MNKTLLVSSYQSQYRPVAHLFGASSNSHHFYFDLNTLNTSSQIIATPKIQIVSRNLPISTYYLLAPVSKCLTPDPCEESNAYFSFPMTMSCAVSNPARSRAKTASYFAFQCNGD